MTQTTITETVKSEGLTLSLLVWRLFKRQPRGYLERVYDMNRGLGELGPHLPVGTKIVFPLDDVAPVTEATKVVKLWD